MPFAVLKRLLLLLLACAASGPVAAQWVLTGRVVNSLGSGVPFALVRNQNATADVLSDLDGYFKWPSKERYLVVEHPAFEPELYAVDVVVSNADTQVFQLDLPRPLSMPDKGTQRAQPLVQHLQQHAGTLNPESYAFTYTAYHKLTVRATRLKPPSVGRKLLGRFLRLFSRDPQRTPHLFMMESVTNREFFPARIDKESIESTLATGLSETSVLTPSSRIQPFNLFSDLVEIPGFRFVSPLAKNTFKRYRFSLSDSLEMNSRLVYLVNFKPKREKNFDGLIGTLYLEAGTNQLLAVVAREARDTRVPLQIAQSFTQTPEGAIFPEKLMLRFELLTGGTSGTVYLADLSTMVSNLSLKPAGDAPAFEPLFLTSKTTREDTSQVYWNRYRGNTYTPDDQRTYILYDSLGDRRSLNRTVEFAEKLTTGLLKVYFLDVNLRRLLTYNEYESFRPGLDLTTNNSFSRWLRLGGYGGYGFQDEEWKYNGRASVRLHEQTDSWLTVTGFKEVREAGRQEFAFGKPQFNSELLRNLRIRKFDELRGASVTAEGRVLRDLSVKLQVSRFDLYPKFDYQFVPRPLTVFRIAQAEAGLRFAYRERFVETRNQKHSLGSLYPVVWLELKRGFSGLESSDFNFWKADARIDYSARLLAIGTSSMQLRAGFVNGEVPYSLLYNGRGSLRIPSVVIHNSFETMRYNEFLNDRFVALFFSHQFGKLLIRRKGFEPTFEVIHNMGIGNIRNPEHHKGLDVRRMNKGYLESGMFVNDLIAFRLYLIKSSIGTGFFYRYGPYAFPTLGENLYFKFSLRLGI